MSTGAAAVVACAVLAAAGALPVVAAVGLRWVAVPLAPLAGAVLSALSATATVALGGPLLAWFTAGSVLAAGAVVILWWRRPARRSFGRGAEHREASPDAVGRRPRRIATDRVRLAGVIGFVGVAAACALGLRGLATPTVGFDARALWIMRAGWFLQSHHQLLVDLRLRDLVLNQSAYPPLVSSSTAVAWGITGQHTARLGVVVVAVLDACALAAAALAVVECGRRMAVRVSARAPAWAPLLVGVVAAVLLVPVAAGVTTPFLTNGYADPLWSLAAVGAVAWGLQLPDGAPSGAVPVLLVLVAGLSKDEGVVTASALAVLIAVRAVATSASPDRRWRGPVAVAAGELAVIASWPLLMRAVHARGDTSSFTSTGQFVGRLHATADGMAPYLHVLVLAALLSAMGGIALWRVRRRGGVANDGWGWAALACGLVAVGGALVTGTGDIKPWILTTVHRITEFPVLAAWWIVAVWAVVAAGALGGSRRQPEHRTLGDRPARAGRADGTPGSGRPPAVVAR